MGHLSISTIHIKGVDRNRRMLKAINFKFFIYFVCLMMYSNNIKSRFCSIEKMFEVTTSLSIQRINDFHDYVDFAQCMFVNCLNALLNFIYRPAIVVGGTRNLKYPRYLQRK